MNSCRVSRKGGDGIEHFAEKHHRRHDVRLVDQGQPLAPLLGDPKSGSEQSFETRPSHLQVVVVLDIQPGRQRFGKQLSL